MSYVKLAPTITVYSSLQSPHHGQPPCRGGGALHQ